MEVISLILHSVFFVVAGLSYSVEGGDQSYTVFNPAPSANNYYVSTAAITFPSGDLTTCFWWKFDEINRDQPHILSMESPEYLNMFKLNHRLNKVKVRYGSVGLFMPVDLLEGEWQFHCVVVTVDDNTYNFTYYLKDDGANSWKSNSTSENFNGTELTNPVDDMVLVLFHEQDGPDGEFEYNQMAQGYISCLNMWSRTYTSDELLVLSKCEGESGDVFSLQPGVGELYGDVTHSKQLPVDLSGGRSNGNSKFNWFCSFKQRSMANLTLSQFSQESSSACVTYCMVNPECLSVNYNAMSKDCELGSEVESKFITRLNQTDNWTHLSRLICN